MEHVMYVQRVKEEKKDQYIKYHKECWPELIKAIKESGIERNIIWLYGNEVLIYTIAQNFDKSMKKLSEKKIFKEWNKKMEQLLEFMQDFLKEGKATKLEKIFDLEEQIS